MPYDPKLHHRRSIRLQGYDYASSGAYFVTVCVLGGQCLLGEIVGTDMHPNPWGRVVAQCWHSIPLHFSHVELDAFAVMPNHLHGIIVIPATSKGDACVAPTPHATDPPATHLSTSPHLLRPGSLGTIVASFKSACTKQTNELRGSPHATLWQRSFWEHVIRSEASLYRIRDYIECNAARWAEDQLHPDAPPNPFNQWARQNPQGRCTRRLSRTQW